VSRVNDVKSRGVTRRYSEALPLLVAPGEYAMVVRGVPRSIVMRCPDDCGEVITVNLDRRTGPAWRAYNRNNRLTIYPSIWRESGCKAHFIVWNNHILWCDRDETGQWSDSELVNAVTRSLPAFGLPHRHFEDIAADLGIVPWEVLWACQALERCGKAISSAKGVKFALSSNSRRRLDVRA
jgi:hypothetical protein